MAPPSLPKKRKVRLPENEELAGKLIDKYRSMMAAQPGGLPEHQELALSAAYRALAMRLQGARPDPRRPAPHKGRWTLGHSHHERLLSCDQPRFVSSTREEKKILITLYGEMIRGKYSMMKQELIDAAEATGLCEFATGPKYCRANPGNSQNDWYTGWSCIKTLISNALVVKWSNPAKYMLTEEGKKTARDCLARSGLDDTAGPSTHQSEEIVISDSDSDEPYACDSDSDEPYPCDSDFL